jgi:hypothetical protein
MLMIQAILLLVYLRRLYYLFPLLSSTLELYGASEFLTVDN